jgi:hypothetical protein
MGDFLSAPCTRILYLLGSWNARWLCGPLWWCAFLWRCGLGGNYLALWPFRKTVRTHMAYPDVHAVFFVGIFWQLEICYFGGGSICSREPD